MPKWCKCGTTIRQVMTDVLNPISLNFSKHMLSPQHYLLMYRQSNSFDMKWLVCLKQHIKRIRGPNRTVWPKVLQDVRILAQAASQPPWEQPQTNQPFGEVRDSESHREEEHPPVRAHGKRGPLVLWDGEERHCWEMLKTFTGLNTSHAGETPFRSMFI